jgi:HD-GYP domain-containing protein (c-di-GMP phosphodiesterase class II)
MKSSIIDEEINFTRILKKSAIQEMLCTFANIAGVSLCLSDKEGKILHGFIQETDDLYRVLVEEAKVFKGVIDDSIGTSGTIQEGDVTIIPGLKFILKSVIINDSIIAFVASGPIKALKPSDEDLLKLTVKFNLLPDKLLRVISSRQILSEIEIDKIRAFIISLAKVISEFCQQEYESIRNISRLSSLYNISNNISSFLHPEPVLKMVLDEAMKLLEAEQGSIMLLNEDRDELMVLVESGFTLEDDHTVRVGEGIAGNVVLEGKPYLILREKKDDQNEKSSICVPLKARERILGVVSIKGKRTGEDFSEDELNLLEILASSAAVSIDNAKLYEKIERKAWELSTLFHIGTAINSSLDRDQVLQKVLDSAIMLLDARKGSLMLIDHDIKEMNIVAACGLPPEIIKNTVVKLGEGIAGKVAQEGKPRLMKKGVRMKDSRISKQIEEIKSAMSVPLKVKDKIQGVMNISDKGTNDNFTEEDLELLMMMANQAAIAIENSRLHAELQELFISSIKALANAIDARDPYTRGHSERVTEYSVAMAEAMKLDREEIDRIRYAALLHDIGKINIPDHILNKPGKLTDEEFGLMKKHPVFGAQIMGPVKAFQKILPYMFHHHERFSARGYPYGIEGEEIPLPARIIAVADSFDAMTSDRPYRKALTLEAAIKELKDNSGTQFDPDVVKIFINLIEEGKFPNLILAAQESNKS